MRAEEVQGCVPYVTGAGAECVERRTACGAASTMVEQWRGDQVERAHGEALEEDCTRRCRGVCRTAWSTRYGAGSVHWSRRGTLDKVLLFPEFFVVQNACF